MTMFCQIRTRCVSSVGGSPLACPGLLQPGRELPGQVDMGEPLTSACQGLQGETAPAPDCRISSVVKPLTARVGSSVAGRRRAVVLPAPGRPSTRILVGTPPFSPRLPGRAGRARPNEGFRVRTGADAAARG